MPMAMQNSSPDERLNASQWHQVMVADQNASLLTARVSEGRLPVWGAFILEQTTDCHRILEVGSGTSEISLALALRGHDVTLVDYCEESLAFSRECAKILGVMITTICSDATTRLPFNDDAFDCTWTSGLMEHFHTAQRREMFREQVRITASKVISMVPNAAALAYHVGKLQKEENGTWRYGLEMPLYTQQEDFLKSDLEIVEETTLAPQHALCFLETDHPLRKSLEQMMANKTERELSPLRQGYLLATVGVKRRSQN